MKQTEITSHVLATQLTSAAVRFVISVGGLICISLLLASL
jgi:hypothetical protein